MINELYRFDFIDERMVECPACAGLGVIDIGDCEDGIQDECPRCEGRGEEEADVDIFDPKRDAFQAGD